LKKEAKAFHPFGEAETPCHNAKMEKFFASFFQKRSASF